MNASSTSSSFLHPASGLLLLGLDWVLFSGNVVSLGLSTVALSLLGFVGGMIGIGWIQRHYGQDSGLQSLVKGTLAGVVIGLPLPIAGTAAGGAVLAMSGLKHLRGGGPQSSDDSSPPQLDENASS